MNLAELETAIGKMNCGCIYPTEYVQERGLREGEVWLATERCKMTWFEAVELAASRSNIRLPHYRDLIDAVQYANEDFQPLEEGEFWTVASESYKPNGLYACCLTDDHAHYTSHNFKHDMKWVRFIKVGDPAKDLEKVFAEHLPEKNK